MFQSLLLIAALVASTPNAEAPVQSKNGEFIFSQYPPRAKAAGEQGSVRFQAEVDAKGNVMSCKVTASSGFKRLDRETCDMIVEHATFKPALDAEGQAHEAVHEGMVNWRIPGESASTKVATAGGRPLDEIVCKRITKTGSLVSGSRACMTRREWSQAADNAQEDWGSLQGRKGFSICPVDPVTKALLC
jgi:protein TonB